MKIGFDNDKYLALQAEHIKERRSQFGDKLYLEFGGKLFDDYHASRVLPGFRPDSKIRMLATMKDEVEIVIAICAGDIEKSKIRGDLGISYDDDVLRLTDVFRGLGFYVGSVVITQYAGQPAADAFIKRLTTLGVKSYKHYPIAGYPSDVAHIVSDDGLGKNDYIETSRSIVVVTAPGPGIDKELDLLPASIIAPISDMKLRHLGHHNPRLHSDEVLIALSISAVTNPLAERVLKKLDDLRGSDAHFSVILSEEDSKLYKRLGIHVSCEPKYEVKKLYHK